MHKDHQEIVKLKTKHLIPLSFDNRNKTLHNQISRKKLCFVRNFYFLKI